MAFVLIPVVFRGPTHGEAKLEIARDTIGACLDAVEERFPGLRELVIDAGSGGIHRFVKLTLNGVLLERSPSVLHTPVSAKDEIEVIAAIAGGEKAAPGLAPNRGPPARAGKNPPPDSPTHERHAPPDW